LGDEARESSFYIDKMSCFKLKIRLKRFSPFLVLDDQINISLITMNQNGNFFQSKNEQSHAGRCQKCIIRGIDIK
jgi:hypothetical protein